jgi:predicted MFS family arabinose efflux permease
MGLYSTVTSIAVPGSAVLAGLLIDQIAYVALFPFVAAMFLLSLVPLVPLTIEKSQAARALRQAQTGATAGAVSAE